MADDDIFIDTDHLPEDEQELLHLLGDFIERAGNDGNALCGKSDVFVGLISVMAHRTPSLPISIAHEKAARLTNYLVDTVQLELESEIDG